MSQKAQPMPRLLFVGIDWADQEHAVCWLPSESDTVGRQTVAHNPEAIAEWITDLQARYPEHRLLVALEQSRGALIANLAEHSALELYPVNPKQLASYRDAVFPSGGKNDASDAELLAQFLKHHHGQLRPRQPDDEQTRRIAELSELRRKLVEDRKRVVLQLTSTLKLYFPFALTISRRELYNSIVLDLLRRWPSLRDLQRAHPRTLRTFLREHGLANEDQQTEFIESVRSATPLTTDQALIQPRSKYAQVLVQQIRDLNQAVSAFNDELQQLVARHPDQEVFRSLPGAGDALVPRLIAAFGSDRDKYDTAEQVQCSSGIAPVTKQSGKSLPVNKRMACPKFLRQTFHEFADHARKWSTWSRAFYNMKRSQGMKHHAAVRALAYKWIRIIFRLWKTRTTYSEANYIAQLRRNNSPVIQFLNPVANP